MDDLNLTTNRDAVSPDGFLVSGGDFHHDSSGSWSTAIHPSRDYSHTTVSRTVDRFGLQAFITAAWKLSLDATIEIDTVLGRAKLNAMDAYVHLDIGERRAYCRLGCTTTPDGITVLLRVTIRGN